MTAPQVGVLALQGDVREHIRALEAVGARARTVRSIGDLASVDALVLPGGESTTISMLAVRDQLMEPLREARRSGMPMYGSCAGMILLADSVLDGRADQQTIGGLDIVVRRNAFGRQVDSFETSLEMPVLGEPDFHAVFIRAPWVESVGDSVEPLGVIDEGERAGTIVAVQQDSLLATSFHPELTADTRIHQYFVDKVVHA
jgi:5'-phosphate synthase pdxT subunit